MIIFSSMANFLFYNFILVEKTPEEKQEAQMNLLD